MRSSSPRPDSPSPALTSSPKTHQSMSPMTLALHGGAGTLLRGAMTPEREAQYRLALEEALDRGYAVLEAGGSALDAVEQAVCSLEDCPLFNAGRGSVFTATGGHEMDAAIMDGRDCSAGAVALLRSVRNPIALARRVMERSGHVFLAGEGAEEFARQQGLNFCPPEWFHDDFRYAQWQQVRGSERVQLDHSDRKFGTVGAVALDARGNLAAATSTGGMTNKRFGRIGDSPVTGAGNYADNNTCAVSCTGSGEYFIRAVAAYDVAARMAYGGLSLDEACRRLVHERLPALGGDGGLIALDRSGHAVLDFNTEGMYRGLRSSSGARWVAIYRD
jgi:beta-aspartyl-peptidase (threonine type)